MTTQQRWLAIRGCLEQVGADFAKLAMGADPDKMATRDWSVAETTAHVTAIAALYRSLARDEPELAFPELGATWLGVTVDTIHEFNAVTLRLFRERRIPPLADRLATEIDGILQATVNADPAATVVWLGDARVPLAGLLAHLINELLIHGRDIARATGQPWSIGAEDAAHFVEAFLVGMLRNSYGRLADDSGPARDRRIAVQFRSAHTTPVAIVLEHGVVTIEEPRRDNDVRLSFDPAILNLTLFGRVSKARAVLTGGMKIRGPRPWLLPEFLRTVRLPS
jgi:hypothetical protein